MKIRNGFVSNSSSSSFVIKQTDDPLLDKALKATNKRNISVKEVALIFFQSIVEEDQPWFDDEEDIRDEKEKHQQQRERIENCSEDVKYISFPTYNEITEVFEYNDEIVASVSRSYDHTLARSLLNDKAVSVQQEEEGYPYDYDFDPRNEHSEEETLEI